MLIRHTQFYYLWRHNVYNADGTGTSNETFSQYMICLLFKISLLLNCIIICAFCGIHGIRALRCSYVQYHTILCISMNFATIRCKSLQFDAILWNSVHFDVLCSSGCNLMPFDASILSAMQFDAIGCNSMQCLAIR